MKTFFFLFFSLMILICVNPVTAQLIKRQPVTAPATIIEKPDPRILEQAQSPEFKVTVNTWSAGKISESQAVISYSIRIDDTTQPMEHGVCYSTTSGPAVTGPKTTAKGYTTNTLYGTLSGLKPGTKIYARAYLQLLNYPDKIYYGNEISFSTLQQQTK